MEKTLRGVAYLVLWNIRFRMPSNTPATATVRNAVGSRVRHSPLWWDIGSGSGGAEGRAPNCLLSQE